MATITAIAKRLNEQFAKETIRQIHNGQFVTMRDTANKLVKMIPANVSYEGEYTSDKEEIVQAKKLEIRRFLVATLCGDLEIETRNGITVNFPNARGIHSFSIHIAVHHLDFNRDHGESKQVYFEVFTTKAY